MLREPGQAFAGNEAGFRPPLRDSGQIEIRKSPETRVNCATNYWFYNYQQPTGCGFWSEGRLTKQKTKRITETVAWEGRDELNLAEFPIASLSSRPNKARKTLQFEDRIWDKGLGRHVTRKLTITASDHYGLPTTLDDEVILGLIQLTRQNDFGDRRVFFSRYELIRLLGWRNEGKSYTRLETSLKRWLGVTFYYENAWWDKKAGAWVNESFHLLERVSILGRTRQRARSTAEPALSAVLWNEVVFRSFQAGYLKRIDMGLFRRLKSPIAKRLFRFLDKRFHHKTMWEFNLRELAHEHIGLSRSYDTGQLKRKLLPAIVELEESGYLRGSQPESRFVRIKQGVWHVVLIKGKAKSRDKSNPVVDLLVRHGVNRATAERLAAEHPAERIAHHVQVLDWVLKQPNIEKPTSPAGYLVQSIRQAYDPPTGFGKTVGKTASQSRKNTQQSSESRLQRRVAAYWNKLSDSDRNRLEQAAMASATEAMLEAHRRARQAREPLLIELYRRLIIENHVTGLLARRGGKRS